MPIKSSAKVFSVDQVADILDCCSETVRTIVSEKQLHVTMFGKSHLIEESLIDTIGQEIKNRKDEKRKKISETLKRNADKQACENASIRMNNEESVRSLNEYEIKTLHFFNKANCPVSGHRANKELNNQNSFVGRNGFFVVLKKLTSLGLIDEIYRYRYIITQKGKEVLGTNVTTQAVVSPQRMPTVSSVMESQEFKDLVRDIIFHVAAKMPTPKMLDALVKHQLGLENTIRESVALICTKIDEVVSNQKQTNSCLELQREELRKIVKCFNPEIVNLEKS